MERNLLKTCINYVHLSTYRLRTKKLSSNFLNQIKNIILTWCSQFPFIELQEIYRFRIFPVGLVREADGSGILERAIFQTFWKLHCCAKSLFFELETSNCGYLLIFWFPLTVQSFSKIGQHWFKTIYKGPPFDVFWFCNIPKIHGGTLIRCLISMLSNLTEILHSQRKSKNRQVATIWSL